MSIHGHIATSALHGPMLQTSGTKDTVDQSAMQELAMDPCVDGSGIPRDRPTLACCPFTVMVRASRKQGFLHGLRTRGLLVRATLERTTVMALAPLVLLGGCSAEAPTPPDRLEVAAAKARTALATLNAMAADTATKLDSARVELRPFAKPLAEPAVRAKRQRIASLLGEPRALLLQASVADRAVSDYLVFQQIREERGRPGKRVWLKQLDRQSDDLRQRLEIVTRASLGFKLAIDELSRVDTPLSVVDQAISEAKLQQRDGDRAIQEAMTLIRHDRPTPKVAQSMAQRIRVALLPGTTPNCNDDCLGGASCFSRVKRPWWCGDNGCSCGSGLACLDGPADVSLPPGKHLRLRFSNLRRTNEDDLCKPPLTETVCVRAPHQSWHCFTREDACLRRTHYLGPHSSESITITTDELMNGGLDITLWNAAPAPDQIDGLLTEEPKSTALLGILKKAKTTESDVQNVGLCEQARRSQRCGSPSGPARGCIFRLIRRPQRVAPRRCRE